jgi:hypothetical protein
MIVNPCPQAGRARSMRATSDCMCRTLLGHLTAMPPTSLASKERMDAQLKKALDCSDEEEPPLFGHTSIYVLQ